jgi:hypothetical protein
MLLKRSVDEFKVKSPFIIDNLFQFSKKKNADSSEPKQLSLDILELCFVLAILLRTFNFSNLLLFKTRK